MIQVQNLSKRFPLAAGGELRAVDSVSFTVPAGEVYGLLGPNGAGKTTTLRMILGLLQPSSGEASIAGFSSLTQAQEAKRHVGIVNANAGMYQWLSVREYLLFFADLYGVARPRAEDALQRLCNVLDFRDLLDRRCITLSTGQKQRVQLARALMHDPPVLLLDEPTSGLDVFGSQIVLEYLAHLRNEGKAAILTTHRLDESERLCDRFGLLHKGRLVCEGSLEVLRERTGCHSLVEMFLRLSHIGPQMRTEENPVDGGVRSADGFRAQP
jgi:ABC-2 type transport system ATP-binding protein/sodium transport system ATP-binding protein